MKGAWASIRLKHTARNVVEPATSADANKPFIGLDAISSWTGAIEVRDEGSNGEVGNRFQRGDVLFGKLRPYLAKVAAPHFGGHCSGEALVIRPRRSLHPSFLFYLMANPDFINAVDASTYGAKMPRASWHFIGNMTFALPNLPTQRRIADFLDRETARIDLLIEKKQRLVEMFAPRFEALIHEARKEGDWRRFGFCAQTTPRPIPHKRDETYVPLGLYNRGRGFFQKPETAYDDLGDSSFFFVKEGDLVFSGQFAWEGAIGLVSNREHGCVVSHRYPVYTGIKGVLSDYLFAYFRSHHGRFLMDNCSRGAAGRNRPMNTSILEKEKIPVPNIGLQQQIAKVIEFERLLKVKIAPSIDRLREYRAALITAAVTGQIDVDSHTRSGATDRRLDAIQEELGA